MKNIKKLVLFITMIIVISGVNIYAASVGDRLTQPEEGWKRYNDTDENIIYEGLEWSDDPFEGLYMGQQHSTKVKDNKIKVKFFGTKLRILSSQYTTNPHSVPITIDNTDYTYNHYKDDPNARQIILFEIDNLPLDIHTVTITAPSSTEYISLDAIDIDDNGKLLPFDTPNIPLDLTASAVESYITLNWDAVSDADSYTILRSTISSTIHTVIATGVKETTYIDDTNVEPGVTYYYIVRAVKNDIESPDSNIASAMIENTNTAVLQIKLSTTDVYEYRITMNEVDNFMKWYIDRANGIGLPFYSFSDESKIEPYTDVNEYLIFDKIIWFKVKEYLR